VSPTFDIGKAQGVLGFVPRKGLVEGLEEMVRTVLADSHAAGTADSTAPEPPRTATVALGTGSASASVAGDQAQMRGKTILVTGATRGIGRVTALELARLGATVVAVGRNTQRGEELVKELEGQGPGSIDFIAADLSSQAETRRLADQFLERASRLDVLINNAGGFFEQRQLSVDGIEMTFAVNHLAYFLLTNLLLPALLESVPSRLVNVASHAHFTGHLNLDDLQATQYYYDPLGAYSGAKLANLYFTYALASRLEGTGVTVNALHPGFIATEVGARIRDHLPWAARARISQSEVSVEQGAETIIYLASAPELEATSGMYFDKGRPTRSSPISYDPYRAEYLWQACAQLTGLAS
jgi:NAD(P)-dependent dehydrogenase (short-subunit alcohol dehydrogenase family)